MGVVGEEVGVLLVLEVGGVGAVQHVLVLVGSGRVVVVGWLEALISAILLEILLGWLGFFVFFVISSIVSLILILLSKSLKNRLGSSHNCGSRRTSPCLRSSRRGCGCCRGGSSLCGGSPWRWR